MPTIACSASPTTVCVVDSASVRFYDADTLAPIGSVFPSPALLGPSNDYACAWDERSGYFILANAIPGYGLSVAAVKPTQLGGVALLSAGSNNGVHFAELSIGGDDLTLCVNVHTDNGSNRSMQWWWDRARIPLQLGTPRGYFWHNNRRAATISPVGESHTISAGFNARGYKRTDLLVTRGPLWWRSSLTRYTPCTHHLDATPAAARHGNTLVVARPTPTGAQIVTINVGPPFPSGGIPPSADTGIVMPGAVSVAVANGSDGTALLVRGAADSHLLAEGSTIASFPTKHTAVCALPDGAFAVATPTGVTRH